MTRPSICCWFILAIASSLRSQVPPDCLTSARLLANESDFDFGVKTQGDVAKHVFVLRSAGKCNLLISSAQTSCSCTGARLFVRIAGVRVPYTIGSPLPPGTEIEAETDLRTESRSGLVSGAIIIASNDAAGSLVLHVAATIEPFLCITPPSLSFGSVGIDDLMYGVERKCDISRSVSGQFSLSVEQLSIPRGVTYRLVPVGPVSLDRRAERWSLIVKIGAEADEGLARFSFHLCSDKQVPVSSPGAEGERKCYGGSVSVVATVVHGLMHCDPGYISFGAIYPGISVSRTIRIQCFDRNFGFQSPQISVVNVRGDKLDARVREHLSYSVHPTSDHGAVDVELSIDEHTEALSGILQGSMIIRVGHPLFPEVKVPFSGIFRQKPKTALECNAGVTIGGG